MRTPIRNFDHAVLPVFDLSSARFRLESLGFTVAPDAVHPFGTENCCVWFGDGTYLEPLGIAQRETCEATALKGNQFTLRDQTYRFRNGDEGFSAIALKSANATEDHKAFRKTGISAGRRLTFSRPMKDKSGNKAKAKFGLAFARDTRAPDAFAFTVERIAMPAVDRSALETHKNGVLRVAEIIVSESNPTDFQYAWQELTNNREIDANSMGMSVDMGNAMLEMMTPEGMAMRFGVERTQPERGFRFEGIVFEVADFQAIKAVAAASDISLRERHGMLIADRAPGQGAFFAFMETA